MLHPKTIVSKMSIVRQRGLVFRDHRNSCMLILPRRQQPWVCRDLCRKLSRKSCVLLFGGKNLPWVCGALETNSPAYVVLLAADQIPLS